MLRHACLLVLLCAAALTLPSGCRAPRDADDPRGAATLRVLVVQNADRVELLAARGSITLQLRDGRSNSFTLRPGMPVTVARSHDGWMVGARNLGGGELLALGSEPGAVAVEGRGYRGRLRFIPIGDARFDVVNDVDTEDYLRSVTSRELLPGWHLEAYKAQTVAARTFALYEARAARRGHFDLYADTRSQVYGGFAQETPRSVEAVDATRGIVVASGPRGRERIFKAYFSSCCGGVGQSSTDAFGDAYNPALGEKMVGTLCSASPRYSWTVVIDRQELTRRIRAWARQRDRAEASMGTLARIDIAAVNRFGRPTRYTLTDGAGRRYTLRAEELRWACNADPRGGPTLNSGYFRPVNEGDAVRFADGRGWGHGVGLCQWCTQARALQGMAYDEILRLGYPGAVLVRAY